MKKLTHFNSNGHLAQVHVKGKPITRRRAQAYGEIHVGSKIIQALREKNLKKGDALAAAKIAGILAAKQTSGLIPLCHAINLDWVDIAFRVEEEKILARATVETEAKTGVEMEALTAVSIACLTLYDMCKSLNKAITIGPIYLLEKTGGKSGHYTRKSEKGDKGKGVVFYGG